MVIFMLAYITYGKWKNSYKYILTTETNSEEMGKSK